MQPPKRSIQNLYPSTLYDDISSQPKPDSLPALATLLPNAISYSSLTFPPLSAMHSIPLSPTTSTIFLLFFFYFSIDVTASFPSDAEDFSNCSRPFNCGTLRNVSYPFTGGDRPSYCGLPEFRLTCVDDSPEITIMSLTYRVLRLDPVQQSMTLARLDLWNETCPVKVERDLCSNSYFLLGPIPNEPILNIVNCSDSLRVPILLSMVANLTSNRSLLGEALMSGFEVDYIIPQFDRCVKRMELGQMCAFDTGSNKTGCVCGTLLCSVAGAEPSLKWKLTAGASGGRRSPERTKFSAVVVFREVSLYSFISVYYFFQPCCISVV